jgi:hypothetical protein
LSRYRARTLPWRMHACRLRAATACTTEAMPRAGLATSPAALSSSRGDRARDADVPPRPACCLPTLELRTAIVGELCLDRLNSCARSLAFHHDYRVPPARISSSFICVFLSCTFLSFSFLVPSLYLLCLSLLSPSNHPFFVQTPPNDLQPPHLCASCACSRATTSIPQRR